MSLCDCKSGLINLPQQDTRCNDLNLRKDYKLYLCEEDKENMAIFLVPAGVSDSEFLQYKEGYKWGIISKKELRENAKNMDFTISLKEAKSPTPGQYVTEFKEHKVKHKKRMKDGTWIDLTKGE